MVSPEEQMLKYQCDVLRRIEAVFGPRPGRDPRDADTYAGEVCGPLSADKAAKVAFAHPPATRAEVIEEALTEARQIAASARGLVFLANEAHDLGWIANVDWSLLRSLCDACKQYAEVMHNALVAAKEGGE
jgi:hypothetical protein